MYIPSLVFSVNPAPYCTMYPNALMPNPSNCGQFFDCRQPNTMFGNYLRECPYLQLYSDKDKTCHSFDRITCGTRFEPKAPCTCFAIFGDDVAVLLVLFCICRCFDCLIGEWVYSQMNTCLTQIKYKTILASTIHYVIARPFRNCYI